MTVGPSRRSVFWATLALTGLCAGVFLLGVHAEKPKKEPQTLVRSSVLRILEDGRTLIDMVVEVRRIVVKLDEETLAAKAKLPSVKGVFEPIHLGLTKASKPNEYGGGMSPRLEFIKKNLAKSLQALARLPSSCEGGGAAQWRAGVAAQQLLLKTIVQARQAKVQATWTAQESDKLIQTALRKLKDADDETSAAALDAYNKKLQSGLAAVAKALGEGLAGKSLDKKVMPKLGGKCGSVQAMELPTQKEAGMQLASAASKSNGAKTAVPISSKSKSAKSDAALPNARGGGGSSAQKGSSASLDSGKADTSKSGKSLWAAPVAVISPSAAKSGTPLAAADIRKALAAAPSDEFSCPVYSGPADCPKLAKMDMDWWIKYFEDMLAMLKPVCRQVPAECDKARQGLKLAQDCKAMYLANCGGKKCPDGSMSNTKGQCTCGKQTYDPSKGCCSTADQTYHPGLVPIAGGKCGCSPPQVLSANGKSCVKPCPDGKTAPDSKGNCPCGKQMYDPNKGCCSNGTVFQGHIQLEGGQCVPGCGGQQIDPSKKCCKNKKPVDKLKPVKIVGYFIWDCKSRVQVVSVTVVKREKMGCSIGPNVGTLINAKERRFFDPIGTFDYPFSDPKLAFKPWCDAHDHCYGTCQKNANDGADRQKCDDELLKNLIKVCDATGDDKIKQSCKQLAGDIHWGLGLHLPADGGSGAYRDAQKEHCKCDQCP